MSLLVKGFFLGLAIAAPVGPIGLLCLRRSWEQGQRMGLASGLGAATADAIYGAVAGFGLKAISEFLLTQRLVLSCAGGVYLCIAGLRTILAKPAKASAGAPSAGSLAAAYTSTLVLTLTNPMTILFFAALFAGMGLAESTGVMRTWVFIAGVFLGSAAWWLFLSTAASLAGRKLGENWMPWINRISGTVLLAFGLYALTGAVLGW
jgi:threonine/homoserine/homoserine lactone efflux protein